MTRQPLGALVGGAPDGCGAVYREGRLWTPIRLDGSLAWIATEYLSAF